RDDGPVTDQDDTLDGPLVGLGQDAPADEGQRSGARRQLGVGQQQGSQKEASDDSRKGAQEAAFLNSVHGRPCDAGGGRVGSPLSGEGRSTVQTSGLFP